ncbi:MAG: acyl-CoA dehydrogenase family protein [Proteobacteria bacterium]|nr:acyl-CoA dehydrogenase family protein [Pseudomonadota bacterium]
MSFAFTDDQKLLAESADRFIQNDYTFENRRKNMEMDGGFNRAVWTQFAELGWLALAIPEAYGGLGGSTGDAAVLLESLGRGLVVEPYHSTVVLGAGAVAAAGSEAQKNEILPEVAEGKRLLAFAHVEPRARFTLNHVETSAIKDGGGYILNGEKAIVHNAETADTLIVSARTGGATTDHDGVTLFLVDPAAKGVTLRSYPTIDGLRASEVTLEAVQVGADAILGTVGGAMPVIEAVVDRACVLLCAEAAGAMDAAVTLTVDYMKTREQFGRPIGTFQVLQHRAVEMLGAKDFSRALTYRAASVVDVADPRERARAVSAAKVEMGRGGKTIGQEGVQLHGGMGMTDDMAVGHYFKRLTMIDVLFGNIDHHLRRFARLG